MYDPKAQIHNYGLDDPRVVRFASEIGPKVRDYLKANYPDISVCISPIGTGGKYFGLRLKGYLDGEEIRARLLEIDKLDTLKTELIKHKQDIRGTVFIGVDDAIWTARTYNLWKNTLEEIKQDLGIVDLKFAVEHDSRGIADWYCKDNIPHE